MTNKNLTHILGILDRSGSMITIKKDTEGGWDTFIKEQAKLDGECRVTLTQFDTEFDTVYTTLDVNEVPSLNLVPRSGTALLDAIGRAVTAKGEELAKLPENERPGAVVVVVLTDGEENSSREWTPQAVRGLVQQQQDVYSWNFIFMGSNQDAVLAGQKLGFLGTNSITYTGQHTMNAFAATASNVSNYRTDIAAGLSNGEAVLRSAYSGAQRAEAVGEEEDSESLTSSS